MCLVGVDVDTDIVAQLPSTGAQASTTVAGATAFADVPTGSAVLVVGLQRDTLSIALGFIGCACCTTSSLTDLSMGTGVPTGSAVSVAGLWIGAYPIADGPAGGASAYPIQARLSVGAFRSTSPAVVGVLGEVIACSTGAASTDSKFGVSGTLDLAFSQVAGFGTASGRGGAFGSAGTAVVDVGLEIHAGTRTKDLSRGALAYTRCAGSSCACFATSAAVGDA